MKGWGDLGVVETIFEEETEEDLQSLSSSLPLSPPLSSISSPLHSAIDAWTTATGREPDVKIYVQGVCFHLHKDLLTSESSYLSRQLIGVSEYTLSPPSKITAETFKQVADFCYSGHAVITPSNVAALRTAAELLLMDGETDGESLREMTESYFSLAVAVNGDLARTVFSSCLSLLPEAEKTASLASRCLEALFSLDDGDSNGDEDGNGIVSCGDELKKVAPVDFRVIAESMQRRFTRSHDLLYRVVDLYFLVYDGKMSEEQKTQICSCIDCSILSSGLLMHAVQNPCMPLRFIVQAMLIEQLNTHRSIFSALNTNAAAPTAQSNESPATLGAILERDAALRQVSQLRAAIDTTSSRIQTLERELSGMKRRLAESEKDQKQPGRSSSCRFSGTNKVERGDRGSVSASMLRFGDSKIRSSSKFIENTKHTEGPTVVKRRSLGQRFITGLKKAFGGYSKVKEEKMGDDNRVITILEAFRGENPHHRSRSVS